MKKARLSATILLIFSMYPVLNAAEAELAYHLTQGDTYYLDMVLQQSSHSDAQEQAEMSFYTSSRYCFRVDSLSGGLIYMDVSYSRLKLSLLASHLGVDINSVSGRDMALSHMLKQLEDAHFRIAMTGFGRLEELEGLKDIFSSMKLPPDVDSAEYKVVLKTLYEAFGPESFQSHFGIFLGIYPSVSPMSNWTKDLAYYFNFRPVPMTNRYHLSKVSDEQLTIQGMGMLQSSSELVERTEMGRVKSVVSGSQTYDFQVDPASGWPIRCVSRQRVRIETTIIKSSYLPSGLKIPSYTETTYEVSGGKMDVNH